MYLWNRVKCYEDNREFVLLQQNHRFNQHQSIYEIPSGAGIDEEHDYTEMAFSLLFNSKMNFNMPLGWASRKREKEREREREREILPMEKEAHRCSGLCFKSTSRSILTGLNDTHDAQRNQRKPLEDGKIGNGILPLPAAAVVYTHLRRGETKRNHSGAN